MHRRNHRTLLLLGCTLIACGAWAQGHDPGAPAPRSTAAPAPANPTGTNVTTLTNSNVLGVDASGRTFARLDRKHKGYLTRSDVDADSYLSEHFGDCDRNADAQLSRSEVDACWHARER